MKRGERKILKEALGAGTETEDTLPTVARSQEEPSPGLAGEGGWGDMPGK